MIPVGLELQRRYHAEFSPLFRAARVRLDAYATTLPACLQPAVPARWRDTSDDFSGKPYAPMMAEFFGIGDAAIVVEALVAGLLMEAHCCLQDARIDGHADQPAAVSESLGNILLADSLARFDALSGDAAALTPHVRRAFADLAEGYAAEAAAIEGTAPERTVLGRTVPERTVPERTVPESMARGASAAAAQHSFRSVTNRAAPFHILVASLGLRAGRPEKIEACSEMARHLLFWFQIVDDVTDWPNDFRHGRNSYLLHRLKPYAGNRPWTEREVENALYLFGGAESLVDEATRQLEAAHRLARTEGVNPRSLLYWLEALLDYHRDLRAWCIQSKLEFLASA